MKTSMPNAAEVFSDSRLIRLLHHLDTNASAAADERCCNINSFGEGGLTPLMWSVGRRSISAIEELLLLGADASVQSNEGAGLTALHRAAAMEDSSALIDALLRSGVSVDIFDSSGIDTPLLTAIACGMLDSVNCLLRHGADPNRKDDVGNTPLHKASDSNNPNMVLALLEAGADPRLLNNQGFSFQSSLYFLPDNALAEWARHGRDKVSDWLIANSVPIEKE